MKLSLSPDMEKGYVHRMNVCGDLEIVEYRGAFDVDVKFIATGTKVNTNAGNIRTGRVKDKMAPVIFGVGFLGYGEFMSRSEGKITKAYQAWHAMFRRCYDEVRRYQNPTYKDCTVCSKWHNFQIFAKWFYENYPQDGGSYDLDKDITNAGNKIYSPDNCIFVTRSENTTYSAIKAHKFISPKGDVIEIVNLAEFCRSNNLDKSTMYSVKAGRITNHKGWTRYVE